MPHIRRNVRTAAKYMKPMCLTLPAAAARFSPTHHPTRPTEVPRCAARGFTLLELLVVMVIIGLLAGYAAPRYFAQVGKSEVKAARAQIDALEKALETYRLDVGSYPSTASRGSTPWSSSPPAWPGGRGRT